MQLTTVEFKDKYLSVMDQVMENHEEVIITKKGKPVARLVPIDEQYSLFGCMKGSVIINDDIINPIAEEWDAEK
ncbi:MAG: type II toxin-antitoxin system Phd/YefM family antitoxin [bacterium]|nr:type II toxin-antitoxin system Phd/YefM family antitoxin [bacterium]